MSDTLTLPAETRERAGKGASRALRREGRVPAVVYGGNEEPLAIHVEEKLLRKQLGTGHFFNSIVEVEVGGKKLRTLPKDVAFHPVNDRPLHADFLRLSKDAKVHVEVPVETRPGFHFDQQPGQADLQEIARCKSGSASEILVRNTLSTGTTSASWRSIP